MEEVEMPVRKWVGRLTEKFPLMKLADSVSEDNKGCTECSHTLFIPCFDHPYCINPKSESYSCHYHSWDVACERYEEGERYSVFGCGFYDGGECTPEKRGGSECPFEGFD